MLNCHWYTIPQIFDFLLTCYDLLRSKSLLQLSIDLQIKCLICHDQEKLTLLNSKLISQAWSIRNKHSKFISKAEFAVKIDNLSFLLVFGSCHCSHPHLWIVSTIQSKEILQFLSETIQCPWSKATNRLLKYGPRQHEGMLICKALSKNDITLPDPLPTSFTKKKLEKLERAKHSEDLKFSDKVRQHSPVFEDSYEL